MPTGSSSTGRSRSTLDAALTAIPHAFRNPIIKDYTELKRRYHARDVNGVGAAATQFCEDVLRWIQEVVLGPGKHAPFGQHIQNYGGACDLIEKQIKGSFDDALRVLVPRGLKFFHSIRSQRGFVHTPGAVSANEIDLATMARLADWTIAELLRTYNKMDLATAQGLIDSLSQGDMPHLWRIGGRTRVMIPDLPHSDRVLLILYDHPGEAVLVEDLIESVEYANSTEFRNKLLGRLHRARLIEFDKDNDAAIISPLGSSYVEKRILSRS